MPELNGSQLITEKPRPTGRAVRHRKRLVTYAHSLDMVQLLGQGGFSKPGFWTSTWRAWSGVSEVEYALVSDDSGPWALALVHRDDEVGKLVAYPVLLDITIPYFGGRRWWFRCPNHGHDVDAGVEDHVHDGDACDRRVRILYRPPGAARFGCRLCHRLTYQSRQEHRLRVYEHLRALDLGFRFAEDLASRSARVRLRALRRTPAVSRAIEQALAHMKRTSRE